MKSKRIFKWTKDTVRGKVLIKYRRIEKKQKNILSRCKDKIDKKEQKKLGEKKQIINIAGRSFKVKG